jgi:Uncharacterized protein conserved in bacteria
MAEKKVQPRAARPKKTALVQAVDLLARQAHSTKKLADKLKQREYEPQEIEAAVSTLTQRGYLNDEDLCRQQFQRYFTESRCSVRYICCKLMNHGFAPELVKACVPRFIDDREQAAALRTLQLKYRSAAKPEKMQQYLYGKGFSLGIARQAVDCFRKDEEIEQ